MAALGSCRSFKIRCDAAGLKLFLPPSRNPQHRRPMRSPGPRRTTAAGDCPVHRCLKSVRDRVQDVVDVLAEERERPDAEDGDEAKNQGVLDECLTLLAVP